MLLEVDQLGRQRCVFRDEIGRVAGGQQGVLGQLVVAQQAGDLAHVHHALDLVDIAAIHRQAGMRRAAQVTDDGLQIIVEVDAGHFVARDHDVIDRDPLQIEDAQQHVLAIGWQLRAGFAYHAAQFLGGQAVAGALSGVDTNQAQQAVADHAGQPDHRVEQA